MPAEVGNRGVQTGPNSVRTMIFKLSHTANFKITPAGVVILISAIYTYFVFRYIFQPVDNSFSHNTRESQIHRFPYRYQLSISIRPPQKTFDLAAGLNVLTARARVGIYREGVGVSGIDTTKATLGDRCVRNRLLFYFIQ